MGEEKIFIKFLLHAQPWLSQVLTAWGSWDKEHYEKKMLPSQTRQKLLRQVGWVSWEAVDRWVLCPGLKVEMDFQ